MGDPITAGAVGSVVAPTFNPITASMAAGAGMGSGSLFGFDPTLGGIGQGITEAFRGPIFGQGGMLSNVGQAAGAYNQVGQALGFGQQPRMGSLGASVRPGGQIPPVDYMSLLNPQQQTVIRPAPVSLL
jgi:hypothetical protein